MCHGDDDFRHHPHAERRTDDHRHTGAHRRLGFDELIVVDGGSLDQTPVLVESYRLRTQSPAQSPYGWSPLLPDAPCR